MVKRWWRLVPGLRAKWKFEERRRVVLLFTQDQRSALSRMALRPREKDDKLDNDLLSGVLERVNAIEQRMVTATDIDQLEYWVDEAESEGQFRAYICPKQDVWTEGCLAMALLEEWGLPKSVAVGLRKLTEESLEASEDVGLARGALRTIYEEVDAWRDYTTDYEETMEGYARWLCFWAAVFSLLAVLLYHWMCRFPSVEIVGLLLAGLAGSCIGVMAHMPDFDIQLSKELDAYKRRILCRLGIGFGASLIGCSFLASGVLPLSIQGKTFQDALNVCVQSSQSGTAMITNRLTCLAIPMLFGYSERVLTWFENRLFGGTSGRRKQ